MNDLLSIPCVLMRGGTSRGPFFLSSDLPSDPASRDAVLLSVMGSGHPLQIDGIGGGNAVTSKIAIVSTASVPGADIDYLFGQVRNDLQLVDYSPNCGNMLAAVGPFAIEAGLVAPRGRETTVVIHNLNTGKLIETRVPTDENGVRYLGDAAIDGVPGLAAPIHLTFRDAAGGRTGKLLPTGLAREIVKDRPATLIDCAMPMVLFDAADFGVAGTETADALSADPALGKALEIARREAGRRMGLGDVSTMVIPKPVLLAPPRRGGTLSVRYFMPLDCHPALATTGAVGIATAAVTAGTIAHGFVGDQVLPTDIALEHPSGRLDVSLALGADGVSAAIVRTARRLFEGHVFAKPAARLSRAA